MEQNRPITMSSSNSFPRPDIATLLSMIQGGGPQNGASQQQLQQNQGIISNVQGSAAGNSDVMSSLLQNLAGALNQQQQQQPPRNGAPDLMSIFAASQYSQTGQAGQALDVSRLTSTGLLGNIQNALSSTAGDQQSARTLANLLSSQQGIHQVKQAQEQALALARFAGARLLSTNDTTCRIDSSRKETEGITASLQLNRQQENDANLSSFFTQRKEATSVEAVDDPTRGRNLEAGAIAVPCRARGMPMDHNPLTAYFVISKGVKHGDDVVCSHPACRNAGVKFRYCSYCKAPVAKRNFRRRHNHGGDMSTVGSDDIEDESAKLSTLNSTNSTKRVSSDDLEPGTKRSKCIASTSKEENVILSPSKSSLDYDGKSDLANSNAIPTTTKQELTDDCQNDELADNRVVEAYSSSTIKLNTRKISPEQREAWVKLLDERPLTDNPDALSKWINKILEVSAVREDG